eukprot:804104-Rhodomonas_salina.3
MPGSTGRAGSTISPLPVLSSSGTRGRWYCAANRYGPTGEAVGTASERPAARAEFLAEVVGLVAPYALSVPGIA